MKTTKQTIVCPGCYSLQDGLVTHDEGAPFPAHVHECAECGYLITESEWDAVEETDRGEWYNPLDFHGDED